jgi:hypothetical protein
MEDGRALRRSGMDGRIPASWVEERSWIASPEVSADCGYREVGLATCALERGFVIIILLATDFTTILPHLLVTINDVE